MTGTLVSFIYRVDGTSMSPTIGDSSLVLTIPRSMIWRQLRRNDVLILKAVTPQHPFVIKRLVGMPGDCIDEYGNREDPKSGGLCTEVPPGTYFVLGDNRFSSEDSRMWGPVPQTAVTGLVCGVI